MTIAMKRFILKPAFLLAGLLTILAINVHAQDLNTATLLTRSEQYDKAADMYKQLIQKDPKNSKVYFYLGENYLLDYFADTLSNSLSAAVNSAKKIYQEGVNANPNDPLNYIGLAKVAYYLGDDKTADEMRAKAKSFLLPYKNIKKISPPATEYAFALAKIAESYIKDRSVDTSLALPLIRQAIKIDKNNRDVYLIAGDIYILVNDGTNSILNYNKAQFADPQSPTAAMKIGSIYVRSKAYQAAIPYFEEAISLNPNYAPAFRQLGQLYYLYGKYDQSKEYFKKYLEITAGNMPARIKYVNSLFFAKDYDEVINNVEEILKVDKSRNYLNRIAAYSCYEKDPPDYDMALSYMETLFKTVAPDRLLWKDYYYMARILLKKNQNYPKMVDELSGLEQQLDRENRRISATTVAAEKARIKASIDGTTAKIASLKSDIAKADVEINRAFGEYNKVLEFKPGDRALLNEIANNYFNYKRYDGAANTWLKMLDPTKDNTEELIRIGRTYYSAEKYKSADSVFQAVISKSPDYVPAYLWVANTYTRMDPDLKLGLAKPKFEKLIQVAQADSIKNESALIDGFKYLGYYYMSKENFNRAREYYNRMINLNPNNKENKVTGYNGLGSLETRVAGTEKTLEGRLVYLEKASNALSKTLQLDPSNTYAKSQLAYVRDFEASVKKGINPNEVKGVIRNAAGQPLPYASVGVKNTAAEVLANSKGEYKFEIPQDSEVLVFKADGYQSKEVPITKSRTYNVNLEK